MMREELGPSFFLIIGLSIRLVHLILDGLYDAKNATYGFLKSQRCLCSRETHCRYTFDILFRHGRSSGPRNHKRIVQIYGKSVIYEKQRIRSANNRQTCIIHMVHDPIHCAFHAGVPRVENGSLRSFLCETHSNE